MFSRQLVSLASANPGIHYFILIHSTHLVSLLSTVYLNYLFRYFTQIILSIVMMCFQVFRMSLILVVVLTVPGEDVGECSLWCDAWLLAVLAVAVYFSSSLTDCSLL